MRRCAVCRSSKPQAELVRFARDRSDEGEVAEGSAVAREGRRSDPARARRGGQEIRWRLDPQRRAGGRGMWVCSDERCHDRKALGRAFRAQAAEVAEQLAAFDEQKQGRLTGKASQNGGIDV